MPREKKPKKKEETDEMEKTIDPYTGELKPVPEDADEYIEVIPEETENRSGSNYLLNEETSMDSYVADANSDAAAEQAAHYTEDEDIEEDFAERQKLADSGRHELEEELEEHHSLSPRISGGDIDASWQSANQSGEETVGGSVVTPDQDVVDQLGDAAGLNYADDEPLDYDAKVLNRDRSRWELNPASSDDQEDELENEEEDEEEDQEEEEFLEDDELEELDELEEDEEDLEELGYEFEDDDVVDAEIEGEDEEE